MQTTRLIIILIFNIKVVHTEQSRPAAPPPRRDPSTDASASTAGEPIKQKIETFLRYLYAWGPSFQVRMGTLKDAPVTGFYEVAVEVAIGEQSDTTTVYVSKDGRYLFRGDMQDMSVDPFAATRQQIRLEDSPSKGPVNAKVTVVEYDDFQCPTCRQWHEMLRTIASRYPQVRFIFKDFPLVQLHPWAMTAAVAGRCAFQQNPESFWKLHDSIFDNQDVISPGNVWQKMVDFASQALRSTPFGPACRANKPIRLFSTSRREAKALKINSTPTVFINGRRLPAADRALLEHYIQYDLSANPRTASREQRFKSSRLNSAIPFCLSKFPRTRVEARIHKYT